MKAGDNYHQIVGKKLQQCVKVVRRKVVLEALFSSCKLKNLPLQWYGQWYENKAFVFCQRTFYSIIKKLEFQKIRLCILLQEHEITDDTTILWDQFHSFFFWGGGTTLSSTGEYELQEWFNKLLKGVRCCIWSNITHFGWCLVKHWQSWKQELNLMVRRNKRHRKDRSQGLGLSEVKV